MTTDFRSFALLREPIANKIAPTALIRPPTGKVTMTMMAPAQ